MLQKIGRYLVLIVALLVIALSAAGIVGAWWINGVASDVTLKVFSAVQAGVEVVDTAVGRVDSLIQTARSEVQLAGEMVTTVASNLQENRPVLTALSERLETRLGPAVDTIQEAIAPVHDALVTIGTAVSFANSIPFIQERAPRLEQLEQTFIQLGALAADVQQLRTTLRTAVTSEVDQLTQAVATALTDLASRVDGRLADIQSRVQALQSEITALQARLQERQSRLLLIYDLIAMAATLLFAWVIYSQVVVVRYHWSRPGSTVPAAATATPEAAAPPSAEIEGGSTARQTAEASVETMSVEAAPDQPAEGSAVPETVEAGVEAKPVEAVPDQPAEGKQP